jgi:hypothetical protein
VVLNVGDVVEVALVVEAEVVEADLAIEVVEVLLVIVAIIV